MKTFMFSEYLILLNLLRYFTVAQSHRWYDYKIRFMSWYLSSLFLHVFTSWNSALLKEWHQLNIFRDRIPVYEVSRRVDMRTYYFTGWLRFTTKLSVPILLLLAIRNFNTVLEQVDNVVCKLDNCLLFHFGYKIRKYKAINKETKRIKP